MGFTLRLRIDHGCTADGIELPSYRFATAPLSHEAVGIFSKRFPELGKL